MTPTPKAAVVLLREAARWTAVLFALNLVWEAAHLPLYSLGPAGEWPQVIYTVMHCTVGDAGIALVSYIVAAALTGDVRWFSSRVAAGLSSAVVVSVLYTVWAEWRNVYVLHNWAYAAAMPMIGGIGVSPLAQWIVLPIVTVWCLRRRDEALRSYTPAHKAPQQPEAVTEPRQR